MPTNWNWFKLRTRSRAKKASTLRSCWQPWQTPFKRRPKRAMAQRTISVSRLTRKLVKRGFCGRSKLSSLSRMTIRKYRSLLHSVKIRRRKSATRLSTNCRRSSLAASPHKPPSRLLFSACAKPNANSNLKSLKTVLARSLMAWSSGSNMAMLCLIWGAARPLCGAII